jgi:hypothetical protein
MKGSWARQLGCAGVGITSVFSLVHGAAVPGYTVERNGFQALGTISEPRTFGWGSTALADLHADGLLRFEDFDGFVSAIEAGR